MTSPATPPTPSAAATVPDRSDRAGFPAAMHAFFTWLAGDMLSDVVALAGNAFTNATAANEKAIAAAQSASDAATDGAAQVALATAQAGLAADSATAAASVAGFVGAWAAQTGALNMPASVTHAGKFWLLAQNLADVTADEPGVSAAWVESPAGGGSSAKSYYYGSM